jgi:UDP-glucose 4-epimerase
MKKRILVTGGTGYIGSHTVVELLRHNYDVTIIDDLSRSDKDVLKGIEKITGCIPEFARIDLTDHASLSDYFQSTENFDAVVHFAAFKAVGESVKFPLKYYGNNLNSMINILKCMSEFGSNYLVFSSSCTVYGQPESLPVTENSPILKADSPYGNTKQISEEIILDTLKSNKQLKAVSLRYFNPIGAHESSEIGELPIGVPDNLVPFITQTAAGIRSQLSVFGNDYNTPDGTAVRDYIHISDLAEAHVKALDRMLNNESIDQFEVFNLGTGKGNSVMEVLTAFEKVTGIVLNYKITDRRPGDVEQVWADTSKANKLLQWKTERSLEDALLSAWNWEKKIRNLN